VGNEKEKIASGGGYASAFHPLKERGEKRGTRKRGLCGGRRFSGRVKPERSIKEISKNNEEGEE